jgi:hypothetical protein
MIGVLVKSTVLVVLAFGLTTALRRQSAAVRHLVWAVRLC